MLYVSFHDNEQGKRNVAAYGDTGGLIIATVLTGPLPPAEAELRGLTFAPSGPESMWVLNGASKNSEIVSFARLGVPWPYKFSGQVMAYDPDPAARSPLWHPFDLSFAEQDGTLYCYVSNQDTNVVARLELDTETMSWQLAPVAPALPPSDLEYLRGTFVASSCGELPNVVKTPPVPESKGGLGVVIEGTGKNRKVTHSVRGVLWVNGALYVADEAGGEIKVYGADGSFYEPGTKLEAPVHLLVHEHEAGVQTLYVSAKKGVYWSPLRADAPGELELKLCIPMSDASGTAFGEDGSFYVANRKLNQISRYEHFSPSSSQAPLASSTFEVLPEPEFIMYGLDGP
jgi:hypothetical protein